MQFFLEIVILCAFPHTQIKALPNLSKPAAASRLLKEDLVLGKVIMNHGLIGLTSGFVPINSWIEHGRKLTTYRHAVAWRMQRMRMAAGKNSAEIVSPETRLTARIRLHRQEWRVAMTLQLRFFNCCQRLYLGNPLLLVRKKMHVMSLMSDWMPTLRNNGVSSRRRRLTKYSRVMCHFTGKPYYMLHLFRISKLRSKNWRNTLWKKRWATVRSAPFFPPVA